jgi:signal transduction histidine kinase/DNA-binding response OmpR family regulator
MAKKKHKNQHNRIKPKVFFGFMMVLGIAIAALAITYRGFIELTETRQSLSDPSKKLIKINSILTDIYDAESNIRTYTLTQNESYLSIYFTFMININEKVDSLLVLTQTNTVQAEKIRFIQELLSRKRRVLNELIELKRVDQSSRFYAMALEEVENLELELSKASSVVTSVTTTTRSRRDSVVNKGADSSPQNAFNRLIRWLSRKEPADTTITKMIVEVETKVDTLKKSVGSPSDSLLNEVVKILSNIQSKQEIALYKISTKELELIKSDKEIMDQIRTVVSLLEREELMNSYKLAEDVKEAVSKSTVLLLSLAGAALLLVILFTWTIFRDISKANFYRNQLLEAKLLAEKLLKVKEEFLANMNHEIRTPLSAIVGLTRQLKRNNSDAKQNLYIDSLNSSSQHLLQIVNDILDLSKIEGNYVKFETIPFSPHQIANDAINTFSSKAKEKALEINLISNQTESIVVLGDPLRLKQILYNLISNAIKFTGKGGITLSIEADINPDNPKIITCNFIVSDTGIGIPAEKIDVIFEQFSQVDSSTTRIYGGTGLGLTIVKRLTELQGGKITVESEPEKGTTFTVQIAYQLSDDEINKKQDLDLSTLQLPNDLKVLVVDDDPIGQLLVTEMLKTLGVKAKVLDNANAAIDEVRINDYAFVLTDIQMPGLSGFDLVTSIYDLLLDKPPIVIALTANSTPDNQNFYTKAGFNAALIKPFNEVELYNTLAPFIGQNRIESFNSEMGLQVDYDISDIRRFAGDDVESTKEILKSFIDNSQINLDDLLNFVEQSNWKGVSEVAHRMKSSFRQLKVFGLANILESLENINTDNNLTNIDINSAIIDIQKEVSRVKSLLQKDLDRLKK